MTYLRHRLPRASLLSFVIVVCLALGATAALADGGGVPPTGTSSARPAPIVYRPPGLSTARKVPLLVAFYGATGCPQCMEGLTHFESLARAHGFVVAYPGSGITNGNWWPAPSDIPYVSSLITQIVASQNIDPTRVYLVGFSAGGRFAYQAACALSRQVTAVAAVSGLQRPYACPLSHPVSELLIEGTTEPVYNGIPSSGAPSAATIQSWWRQRDGCGARLATAASGSVSSATWGPCIDGSVVALDSVQGGHHTWPGCCGLPASDPDSRWNASAGIWAFLSPLRMGSLTTPDASVGATRFAVGRHHARALRTRLRLGESVTVTETLLTHGRRVASGKANLPAGIHVAQLNLPARVKRGSYTLRLVVVDGYGRTRTVSRGIHVTK